MQAITVAPGRADSVRLEDVAEPHADQGAVLARAVAVGICGTDAELIKGAHGAPPPGRERVVIGHESLGEVIEAPAGSGFRRGDLVVGIVRHPDPVPCANCAAGEWDMCTNGRFTERGIKEVDGFGAERWRSPPELTVKASRDLGTAAVLTEPASIVAKAWEHIERIGARAHWAPSTALVTGAGPIGLLAALLGVQRGLKVTVLDRNEKGPKPKLVADLGARFVTEMPREEPDVVVETTGASPVIAQSMCMTGRNGIVCLAGLSSGSHCMDFDVRGFNRALVMENGVVFGSVNANRRHYEAAIEALEKSERGWLERLITRRVPLSRWEEAYEKQENDVKTILEFTA